ncbi:NUDIX hydrolase [Siccirubricoccus deserti]|uniref:NUDIX hydrolase n=1 Tax=Siccirubricoccus deserti TaxID=2013562 RepID=A0A9X0R145_9PROT|nr:NUDIX hydrolase [Siccirubricoccus deserti]MBC4016867.1 NUDIX hydrolase [Siccirubricoccus deserti]GGC52595.1 NUDIX hydrolase [Siccirubricoccus deserti]
MSDAADRRDYPTRPWVGIGVIAFDGDRVLLVRRGKPPREGQWSLPGGAQHLGERAEACARRELFEETGIEVGPLELAAVVDGINRDPTGEVRFHYTIIDFCGHRSSGEARPGDDVAAVAWALPEELPGYDLTPDVLRVIAEAREKPARK